MRHRLTVVGVLAAGVSLAWAAACLAQATSAPAERPKLVPLPTHKGTEGGAATSEGAGEGAASAPTSQPAGADAKAAERRASDGGGTGNMMWFYVAILGGFVLLYVWMGRSRRKQEAKRREMLGNLSKGDKVITIGGIIGTVIEVRPNEVTVKVDETNNVRMKFLRSAISRVGEEVQQEKDKEKKDK